MTVPIRPQDDELARSLKKPANDVYSLQRAQGSGRPRPVRVKAGIPSDADYTTLTMPPIGTIVYDTTNSKIWVRHAAGTWKGIVVS